MSGLITVTPLDPNTGKPQPQILVGVSSITQIIPYKIPPGVTQSPLSNSNVITSGGIFIYVSEDLADIKAQT